MKKMLALTVCLTLLAALLVMGQAFTPRADAEEAAQSPDAHKAPDFTLKDSKGNEHSLADYKGKWVVLEWINHGCPFVRKYYDGGAMQQLQKKYGEREVVWLAICSSKEGTQGYMSPEQWEAANQKYDSAAAAVLLDSEGKVGKAYKAKTTPHMFVIDPQGKIVYDGAIDDKPTADKDDLAGARVYVAEALEAAMAGKPVEVARTKPYGCSVKY